MATIFDGMDQVVDKYLRLDDAWAGNAPRFGHRATLLQLTTSAPAFGTDNLVDSLFDCSQSVWENAAEEQRRCRSSANWRSDKCLKYDENNASLEVVLERLLARITDENWWNQVPVDSGVLDGQGRRNVDMVHREGEKYSVVELKWNANTPLSAAIQVVQYGVAYLFFRRFVLPGLLEVQGAHACPAIMTASELDLVVLAPTAYYDGLTTSPAWLASFERQLTQDLRNSKARQSVDINMSFRFEAFPSDFAWSLEMAADPVKHDEVARALKDRSRLFA